MPSLEQYRKYDTEDSISWPGDSECVTDGRIRQQHRIRPRLQGRCRPDLDLQYDALVAGGAGEEAIYEDRASDKKDSRPGFDGCLKALRQGDTLVVWKLDRLGRDPHHLVSVVQELTERGVGLRVLAGRDAQIDTATPAGSPQAAMKSRDTSVAELAAELRARLVTFCRYVGPDGELRTNGKPVLDAWVRWQD